MSEQNVAKCSDKLPRSLWWDIDDEGYANLHFIDQTRLPLRGDLVRYRTYDGVIKAIKTLEVRGAPAIGVSGALALALWSYNQSDDTTVASYMNTLEQVAGEVANARPTAVNLSWAVNKTVAFMRDKAAELGERSEALEVLKAAIVEYGLKLYEEDIETNMAIGEHGSQLFSPGTRLMTHCNAGSLACVFYGTALGVMYSAYDKGLLEHAYCCETRPVNQGGRLTSWELMMAGIPTTLICDSMSATLMSKGMIDAVIVGADRIAANGDTANKIGTMGHAIIAKHFGIPFYVAAPFSTIDLSLQSGEEIVIEQRCAAEVQGFSGTGFINASSDQYVHQALDLITAQGQKELPMENGHHMMLYRCEDGRYGFDMWLRNTPVGVDVFNPAFDVTPASLIAGIITERGVYRGDEQGVYHFE